MYFNKRLTSYLLPVKVIPENLKQQCLIKIKCGNIHSIQQTRMIHVYCIGWNPDLKKMHIQLALNKTFCHYPRPHTQQWLKQCQRTKFNKTILSVPLPPPHWFSIQSSQYQKESPTQLFSCKSCKRTLKVWDNFRELKSL